jgi:hypothetical protein
MSQQIFRVLGLGVGYGFNDNLEEAYTFLMEHYQEGDKIYLFGFSRGAFTARVLAGWLKRCGLLHPGNQSLVPYARRLYSQKRHIAAQRFAKTFSTRKVEVAFLGVWDTVSSVGFALNQTFLDTRSNRIVRRVRHAMSIDERRAFFRPNRWTPKPPATQDVQEMWFAGCHSDVGGGHPEQRPHSALAKIALRWMVEEAVAADPAQPLLVRPDQMRDLFERDDREHSVPDETAPMHESLKGPWWPLECLPQRIHGFPGIGTRFGRRRKIEVTDAVHPSVLQRIQRRTDYLPANLRGWLQAHCPDLLAKTVERPSLLARAGRLLQAAGWTVGLLAMCTYLTGTAFALADAAASWLLRVTPQSELRQVLDWFRWLDGWSSLATALVAALPYLLWRNASREAAVRSEFAFKLQAITGPTPPHRRLIPQSAESLRAYLKHLGRGARDAYLRATIYDLGVALLYGSGFAVLIWWMTAGLALKPPLWLLAMPALAVAADLAEDVLLIWLVSRYQAKKSLPSVFVGFAGLATSVKMVAFALSLVLCLLANTRFLARSGVTP